MAEFSLSDRASKLVLAPALLGAWWYFSPNYSELLSVPLARLSLNDILNMIGGLGFLAVALYGAISFTYEAVTGRDSVWFWHPSRY